MTRADEATRRAAQRYDHAATQRRRSMAQGEQPVPPLVSTQAHAPQPPRVRHAPLQHW